MTIRKVLTGKPGNLIELIDKAGKEELDTISITYFGRLTEIQNVIGTRAGIRYQAGRYKVEEEWNAGVYGPMISGKERETLEESLRRQAEKSLELIRKSNLSNFDRRFNQMKFLFDEGFLTREKVLDSILGLMAYIFHGNTYKYRKGLIRNFNKLFPYKKGKGIRNNSKFKNFIKKVNEFELEFSTQKTLFLFLKGLTISEKNKKRNLKEDTIWNHLANLIENRQIPLIKVLPKDKIYKVLIKVYGKRDRLKSIKKKLNDEKITYNEIACVMASIKSRRKYKSPS